MLLCGLVKRSLARLVALAVLGGSALRPLAAAPPSPAAATTSSGAAARAGLAISNPELFEKSLEATREALMHYGLLERPADLRRVADIGYRLVEAAGIKTYPVSFYLIDMPEPNAFALPGGQVVVTRGMLDLGLDDDQLAALLGHELGHVYHQHGVKMERRAALLNILSTAALVGVILAAENDGSKVDPWGRPDETSGDLIEGTAAAGLVLSELLLRSYSREFEDQADEDGQRWAAAAGFAPMGTAELWAMMTARLPQDKKYGYWQTHPFSDARMSAARARGAYLKAGVVRDPAIWRAETQALLLGYVAKLKPPPAKEPEVVLRGSGDVAPLVPPREPLDLRVLLKSAALAAWPTGPAAEAIRGERLARLREREFQRQELSRDYGRLLTAWREQLEEVRTASPESAYATALERDQVEMKQALSALYPKAAELFRRGDYETSFLETFVSNYPEAPELPEVSLALGDAYARLGRAPDAVKAYLAAWKAAPQAPPGRRAQTGLRALTSRLEDLAALQELALQADDAELQSLAATRLSALAPKYSQVADGAEYLRRFPTGEHAEAIGARLRALADNLYGEMVLYQSVGDHMKALERIQKILTYAPASPAAERLRERTTLTS